jgi:hypothetical protein
MNTIRDIGKLYALTNKCARAEEGRKLPGEDVGTGASSETEGVALVRRGRWRNSKKHKGKALLAAE